MTSLEKILTAFAAKTPTENNDKDFDQIAVALLENSKIVAGNLTFIVRECEIFVYHEHHKDAFIHNKKYTFVSRQEEFGEWCFYHFKNPRLYAKHKHSGIEFTFGNGATMSASVLIKSVYCVEEDRVIEGTNTIAQTFLGCIGIAEVGRLALTAGKFVFDETSPLHIEENKLAKPTTIFKGAREFKTPPKLKNQHEHTFINSFYRYFNDKAFVVVK